MLKQMLTLLVALSLAASAPQVHAFDGIRLTLVGGDAVSTTLARTGPAALVEAGGETLLFDCGRGVRQALERAGVAMNDITGIFLTQARGPSIAGCVELWQGSAKLRSDPWEVWGPDGTVDAIDLLAATGAAESAPVEAKEVSENLVFQTDAVRVMAFVASRGMGEPAYGYRVEFGRHSVVIAADSRYSESLVRNARSVSILVQQVALAHPQVAAGSPAIREILTQYPSPEDAARVLREARPYLAVYAYAGLFGVSEDELMRRTRRLYSGPIELGRDLLVVEVGNELQIRRAPSEPR